MKDTSKGSCSVCGSQEKTHTLLVFELQVHLSLYSGPNEKWRNKQQIKVRFSHCLEQRSSG